MADHNWQKRALVAEAECARLRTTIENLAKAPPAQMSWNGGLVNVDSDGMRQVIDESARLRGALRYAAFALKDYGDARCRDAYSQVEKALEAR